MTKKIFLTPIKILGLIFIVLGLRWMLVDEPWMLDKVANEERLNMIFEKLFSEEINDTLPGYLKQIYRFFGLWVSIIGLFIISFSNFGNPYTTSLKILSSKQLKRIRQPTSSKQTSQVFLMQSEMSNETKLYL